MFKSKTLAALNRIVELLESQEQRLKALEDLLKCGLTNAVLVYVVLLLQFINHSEHLTNCFVQARNSQPHVVSVLLEKFNAVKDFTDSLNRAKQIALSE